MTQSELVILVENGPTPDSDPHRKRTHPQGYAGNYERVRLYLLGQEQLRRQTFIPLDHDPGQRLEADFGHICVAFPEGRRQVPVLLVT